MKTRTIKKSTQKTKEMIVRTKKGITPKYLPMKKEIIITKNQIRLLCN